MTLTKETYDWHDFGDVRGRLSSNPNCFSSDRTLDSHYSCEVEPPNILPFDQIVSETDNTFAIFYPVFLDSEYTVFDN